MKDRTRLLRVMGRPCSVPGCGRKSSGARRLCDTHATHRKRHGHELQEGVRVGEIASIKKHIRRWIRSRANGDKIWQGILADWQKCRDDALAGLREMLEPGKAGSAWMRDALRDIVKTPSKMNMWTTFKACQNHLAGERYARAFVPVNAKATNEFIEKRSMAYLANIFHHPDIKGFFRQKGLGLDDDLYALSEMIQWVWRSQIRRGDPVTIYIPSQRMRALFIGWLNGNTSVKQEPSLGDRLAEAVGV